MASERNIILWIPALLGVAFAILGLALAKYWAALPGWATVVGAVGAVALFGGAVFLGYQRVRSPSPRGGAGGRAIAAGEDSHASGGRGGDAGFGDGGDGGAAVAKGKRSAARGGDGGRG